jgi:hypothetical protein
MAGAMIPRTMLRSLVFSIFFFAGTFCLVSCSYKYLGPEEPEVFYPQPCAGESAQQARSRAFSVILNAMNARNWHISTIDRMDFEIDARVKGAEWTRVEVKVKPGGVIRIQRKLEEDLSRSHYRFMEESIADLKKLFYKKYRCRSGRRNRR